MLSAIENDKHIPNVKILMQIYNKLGIPLDELKLEGHFKVSSDKQINNEIKQLCDNHQYNELYELLSDDNLITRVDIDIDYQNYYYYLGCASFHVNKDIYECEKIFKLALAESKNKINESIHQGIDYITKNKSVYILGNLHYLLYFVNKNKLDKIKSDMFSELYGEVVYSKISVY